MPLKSDHDFQEMYLYIRVDTLVSMRMNDTLTLNGYFVVGQRLRIRKRNITSIIP